MQFDLRVALHLHGQLNSTHADAGWTFCTRFLMQHRRTRASCCSPFDSHGPIMGTHDKHCRLLQHGFLLLFIAPLAELRLGRSRSARNALEAARASRHLAASGFSASAVRLPNAARRLHAPRAETCFEQRIRASFDTRRVSVLTRDRSRPWRPTDPDRPRLERIPAWLLASHGLSGVSAGKR